MLLFMQCSDNSVGSIDSNNIIPANRICICCPLAISGVEPFYIMNLDKRCSRPGPGGPGLSYATNPGGAGDAIRKTAQPSKAKQVKIMRLMMLTCGGSP